MADGPRLAGLIRCPAPISCLQCRKRKVKCRNSGDPMSRSPCTRCSLKNLPCEYAGFETSETSKSAYAAIPASKSQSEAFLIYTPHERNTSKTAEYSSTPNGLCSLDSASIEERTTALYDPKDAAEWLESNWDSACCISIRAQITNLLPCMLSAEESALVIFGVVENTEIAYVAQSLANASGFSVIVRPTDHDPALTLLPPDPPDFNTNNNQRDGHQSSNDNRSHSWDGAGFSTSGQTPGENEDDEGNYDHVVPQIRYDPRFGDGAGGGDGGDGGQPPTTDDQWESPLHRTRVKLDLQADDARRYAVILGCSFQFKINRNVNLTRPLSQPEVISLFDITIETRPHETQVDRSYANFGFIAHRAASIAERTFLHRGFEQPDEIYQRGNHQESQQEVKASFGFSQGRPFLTSSFPYNRHNNLTMEATDNKVLPKCRVDYEPGDDWDHEGKSFSSYNIAYQPQEAPFRQNSEPIQVRVGMGINLSPPVSEMSLPRISFIARKQVLIWVSDSTSKAKIRGVLVLLTNYLDNIRTPKALCISEQQLVKLAKSSYQFQRQSVQLQYRCHSAKANCPRH
ncbi:hypothetical protein R3P38DRAFT_932410 [Favolaschia claudopus]|uniref:Zn(2)-C6 fungal-type domain-containing protein n=1 Tax=Favolaschia claudopus TaxID=2862362 RepID=A0AAW0BN73_9AGAR